MDFFGDFKMNLKNDILLKLACGSIEVKCWNGLPPRNDGRGNDTGFILCYTKMGLFSRLFGTRIQPMNVVHVSKKAILRNLDYLQSLQPQAVLFPVLKSNAYGHGLKHMAKILKNAEVPYLAIDSYPEYEILRKVSSHQLLLMGETLPENYHVFDPRRVTFCVYSIDTLYALADLRREVKIHIFLNTGMNREGIGENELVKFLEVLKEMPLIKVEGVMSHLYDADGLDDPYMTKGMHAVNKQIEHFKKMYYTILNQGHAPIWRHIGNSAGLMKMNDDFFNAYRPGIAMYGYNPLDVQDTHYKLGKKLTPALSVTSRVVALHTVWPDDGVSYNHKHVFSQREIVGTIPFGYQEGLPRVVSGTIDYKIGKRSYKQVGTICMNLSSFLADDRVKVGDEVTVISASDEKFSLKALAEKSGTIIYECLVRLDPLMRREVE